MQIFRAPYHYTWSYVDRFPGSDNTSYAAVMDSKVSLESSSTSVSGCSCIASLRKASYDGGRERESVTTKRCWECNFPSQDKRLRMREEKNCCPVGNRNEFHVVPRFLQSTGQITEREAQAREGEKRPVEDIVPSKRHTRGEGETGAAVDGATG